MPTARTMKRRLVAGAASLNRAAGRRTGLMIARSPTRGTLEWELDQLLKRFPIDVILDVGAHEGGFATRVRRRVDYQGRILSFEPSADAYDVLADKASCDENWDVLNIALGDEDTESPLYDYSFDGQMNSLRRLSDYAEQWRPGLIAVGATDVQVRRLESLLPELGIWEDGVLLKIDTQGFDIQVVRGAGALLERIPAVLMEVAVQPLYEGAPVVHEVVEEMSERGFELTGAFPVHRYANGARVIEFDCTFVNVQSCGQ